MQKVNIPDEWLRLAFEATLNAGKAILEVYEMEDQGVTMKADHSPLTLADRRADTIIKETLGSTPIPVFTEESSNVPYETRKTWDQYWLVDPLDGTKEFIHHNDEFTVNIALIKEKFPVFGIIYVPVYKQLYFAIKGSGAYRTDDISISGFQGSDLTGLFKQAVRLPDKRSAGIRVAVSRSHMSSETESYVREKLENKPFEVISAGSSLKFCRVAEGEADLYPRLGPTMEWDIAAGVIIVTETGGIVQQYNGEPFLFNRENLLNPWFVAASGKMKKVLNYN